MFKLNEGSDPEHLGLLKEVLRVLFGLESGTIGKVIRIIKSSEDASKVKTNIVRTRVGARAMKYLRNAIEIARHEGIEKHEKEKERDMEKEQDLEPTQLEQEKARKERTKKEEVKECFTFKNFLLSEERTTISVDPNDPASIKREINMAKRNPERANRVQAADARDEKQQAQRDGDPLGTKIAALRMQLKQLELKRAKQQKNKEV